MFVVCRVSSVVRSVVLSVGCMLFVCRSSVVLLCFASRSLFVVCFCCLLFVDRSSFRRLLFVVRCLWFVICCVCSCSSFAS